MIYVMQLIYIQPGQEKTFDEFEAIALPSIQKYNGRLLFRLRPANDSYVEQSIEPPYEIHLVEFASENDLTHYMNDADRQKFLHLKDKAIKSAIIIKGKKL